jgi:uncharacterized Zn-binding protein involved in type VI secretion
LSAAARLGDAVSGTDTHIVLIPSASGTTPVPTPMPFSGTLTSGTSTDVLVNGRGAATAGSTAVNQPPHVPSGGTFAVPPHNSGQVQLGSTTVRVNGKAAARQGDPVLTCNDPVDLPNGTVSGGSPDVMIG